jgi:hypothetical protein
VEVAPAYDTNAELTTMYDVSFPFRDFIQIIAY